MASHQTPFCWWLKLRVTPAVVATALTVNLLFYSVFGTKLLFFLFMLALGIAAYYEGWRAGLLATILTTVAVLYFFVEPTLSFSVTDEYDWWRLMVFAFCGLAAICGVLWPEHAQRRSVKKWRERLRKRGDDTGHK